MCASTSSGEKSAWTPTGGTNPLSPDVLWGPELFDGKAALNRPEMQMVFVAKSNRATIFLRAMAKEGGATNNVAGEIRVWFDAICMKARPDIAPSDVQRPTPIEQTLEQAAQARAGAAKPWMPVNNTSALWQSAKANGLQDQQTDELELTFNGEKYLCQVFHLGVVYVKVGDWGNVKG